MSTPPLSAEVIDILAHFEAQRVPEKKILDQVSVAPKRFYLSTMLVMLWGFFLLALSPLLALQLPDPLMWSQQLPGLIPYGFQIPIVILVSAILGVRFGTMLVLLYLICGFAGLPVFAGGGGSAYFTAPSVGYLFGFLLVPWTIQRILARAYRNTGWFRGRSVWMLLAALLGVGIVHAVGLIGLGIQTALGQMSWDTAHQWLLLFSWPALLYDFFFAVVAITLVRVFRLLFLFCLY